MKKWEDWASLGNRENAWAYRREIITTGHFSKKEGFCFTKEEKRHILQYDVAVKYPTKIVYGDETHDDRREIDFDAPFSIIHTIILDMELDRFVRELPPNDKTQPVTVGDLELDPLGFYIKNGVLLEFRGTYTHPFILPQVSEIGYKAFDTRIDSDSGYLFPNEVVLPYGLKKIGELAFAHCDRLQKINIPDSVDRIGEGAFMCCGLDQELTLSKGIDRIEAETFKDTKLKSVTIPQGVKSIGNGAFMNCYALKSIYLPDSVEEIGELAFARCRSLKNITAPEHIKKLINDMRK